MQAHCESGFLLHLAPGRVLERLPHVDEAAGQGPPRRRVRPLDEHNRDAGAVDQFDHHVDGYLWRLRPRHAA